MALVPAQQIEGFKKVGSSYTPSSDYFSAGTIALYVNENIRKCLVVTEDLGLTAKDISSTKPKAILSTLPSAYRPSYLAVAQAVAVDSSGSAKDIGNIQKNNSQDTLIYANMSAITAGWRVRFQLEWMY